MKKILIVSTVSRQFYLFEKGNIEVLESLGYEVHAAANFKDTNIRLDSINIKKHHIDIERSPFSVKNFKAFLQLRNVMKTEEFDAVHCHSPMGGVLGRLAAKSQRVPFILYTAHGFHFFKGAALRNWLIYYPIEQILSFITNVIITINEEDFKIAQKFHANQVVNVPGIGIDVKKIDSISINLADKRRDLGISKEKVVLLSVGELIQRKNHETVLRSLAKLKNENYIYLICGTGELENYLKDLVIELGLEQKVNFLGYRNDIPEICKASDVFLFPSYQEGLPVSVMEAMAAGLPVICSNIRGNSDLIKPGEGGYLHEPNDVDELNGYIESILSNSAVIQNMSNKNMEEVKKYDKEIVKLKMNSIYKI